MFNKFAALKQSLRFCWPGAAAALSMNTPLPEEAVAVLHAIAFTPYLYDCIMAGDANQLKRALRELRVAVLQSQCGSDHAFGPCRDLLQQCNTFPSMRPHDYLAALCGLAGIDAAGDSLLNR